jgi:hypothetical protein
MLRVFTALAVAVCVSAPAMAADHMTTRQTTVISIPTTDYQRLRDMGYSAQDIFWAYNASCACSTKVDDILAMRKNGRTWDEIAVTTSVPIYVIYGVPTSMVAGQRETVRQTETRRDGRMITQRSSEWQYYPVYERQLPNRFWAGRNRLTPGDYRRMRAGGLRRDQIFMIANASRLTGLDMHYFQDAFYRGMLPSQIADEYGFDVKQLGRVLPEWRTPEWAEATGEKVFTKERISVW